VLYNKTKGQRRSRSVMMKKSLADKIEQYLKVLIERSENNEIEIQRAELAELLPVFLPRSLM
jgi:Mn-dependent DtxR family transcriptional regulator